MTTTAATLRHEHDGARSTARRTRTAPRRPAGSATRTTNPGACNDTFGTRAPASRRHRARRGSTARRLLAGGHAACRRARPTTSARSRTNAEGTAFGAVLSFTTPARADGDDLGGDAGRPRTTRDAQRLGEPERRERPPAGSATAPPTPAPATTPSARARRRPAARRSAPARAPSPTRRRSPASRRRRRTTSAPSPRTRVGTRFGAVLSFTTPAAPPTVTTSRATRRREHGATLNGSANPNGAATTGWFRYAHDQPGHLQRHLRHARAGDRRHRARRRHDRRRLLAAITGLDAGDDVLLLRDRLERARHGVRRGAARSPRRRRRR